MKANMMRLALAASTFLVGTDRTLGQACSLDSVSVTISPSNGGTCSIYQQGDGEYIVTINRNSNYQPNVTATVRGGSSDFVSVNINTNNVGTM